MNEPRTCAGPGCDEPLDGKRPEARYHSDACRARAWKQQVRYGPQNAVRTDKNGGSGRVDLRIAYGRVVARYGERAALELLTERQRAALEEREGRT